MGTPDSGRRERRQSPRFCCTGEAKIIRLPSDGLFLPGKLRDLSLGGCRLETDFSLERDARAEIVVQVNSEIFRALSQVRGVYDRLGVGMEFLRLSASGRKLLHELIRNLARLQEHLNRIRSAREGEQKELVMQEFEREKLRRCLATTHISLLQTMLPEDVTESPRAGPAADDSGDFNLVDIFI